MRNLRIACFACALANFVTFFSRFFRPAPENSEGVNAGFMMLYMGLVIAAVILNVLLARKLNRSGLGWGALSLFLPWVAGFIIPFLGEAEYRPRPSYSWGGTSGGYGGTYISSKSCSACGKNVPLTSRPGQRCPHCGAYWSTETQRRI
jgi:hypothetical protein